MDDIGIIRHIDKIDPKLCKPLATKTISHSNLQKNFEIMIWSLYAHFNIFKGDDYVNRIEVAKLSFTQQAKEEFERIYSVLFKSKLMRDKWDYTLNFEPSVRDEIKNRDALPEQAGWKEKGSVEN